MNRINKFIDDLLNQRGITKEDKEDLKTELLDHVVLLKEEYLVKGYNDNEAINLALNDFGDANEIGNNIKENLPSSNRYTDFSVIEFLKTILFMLLGYATALVYIVSFTEIHYESILFYIIISAVPIIIGFFYVNLKLTSRIKRIKIISKLLIVFLLFERLIMLFIYILSSRFGSKNTIMEFNKLLNIRYITVYCILLVISIIITYTLSEHIVLKIKNPYNAKPISNLLWFSSVVLMILYYLLPNRWYLLRSLFENIIGNKVSHVEKNIIFLTINYKIIIPNVGLVLFIIMGIMLFKQINKKGIESLF